jgi:hypothetical protein
MHCIAFFLLKTTTTSFSCAVRLADVRCAPTTDASATNIHLLRCALVPDARTNDLPSHLAQPISLITLARGDNNRIERRQPSSLRCAPTTNPLFLRGAPC